MKLQAPTDFAGSVTIEGGKEYTPDANGFLVIDNPAHEHVLRQHGFTTATGVLGAAEASGSKRTPPPQSDDDEDEFDDMTKAELIDWIEERDREDDIPSGKIKVDEYRALCRKIKAELDAAK